MLLFPPAVDFELNLPSGYEPWCVVCVTRVDSAQQSLCPLFETWFRAIVGMLLSKCIFAMTDHSPRVCLFLKPERWHNVEGRYDEKMHLWKINEVRNGLIDWLLSCSWGEKGTIKVKIRLPGVREKLANLHQQSFRMSWASLLKLGYCRHLSLEEDACRILMIGWLLKESFWKSGHSDLRWFITWNKTWHISSKQESKEKPYEGRWREWEISR